MNKNGLTADEIWEANMKALYNGRKLPYTKKDHAVATGSTAEAMRYWNECLPNATQYTKQEHAAAEGCTTEAQALWNLALKKAEKYTFPRTYSCKV